jgi:hypothetical protein
MYELPLTQRPFGTREHIDTQQSNLSIFPDDRKSTLLFLRTWLRSQDVPMGRESLSSIREFARSIGGSDLSDTMREVAQEIADLASEKVCASSHKRSDCAV